MVRLEKLKELREIWNDFGALFTDPPIVFDCMDHILLITKLSWYGVTTKSLNLIFS